MAAVKFVVVDPSRPVLKEPSVINWELCLLCQADDGSKLVVPSLNSCAEKYKGFAKLEILLNEFQKADVISSLPFSVNLSLLDDGSGMLETLKKNNAVYHRKCQLKCTDQELQRAIKRKKTEAPKNDSPIKTRRLSNEFTRTKCMFCNTGPSRNQALINVTTERNSSRIIKYATLLGDRDLISKISGAHDLMALEACYHAVCLTNFNNRIRAFENSTASKTTDCGIPLNLSELHAYGLANLAAHIDEVRETTPNGFPIFKMTELSKCYNEYMKDMGVDHVAHTSRLRDRLLDACPHLQSSGSAGQEILITYRADHNSALRAAARDFHTDAFRFADVAKVVRSDIFTQNEKISAGNVEHNLLEKQEESTPLSLKVLLKMLLRGPGSIASGHEDDEEADFDQVVNSMAQLISFHAIKRVSKSTTRRLNSEREKPVPLFLAMKIYGATRSETLINLTHQLGLSISYDRLHTILNEKANIVSQRYALSNVVCPPALHSGDFTIGAVDNIDHDTSSYTAKTSFHGTAMSLMQFPDVNAPGVEQELAPLEPNKSHNIALPDNYSLVKHCSLNVKSVRVPSTERCTFQLTEEASAIRLAKEWLDNKTDAEILPWPVYNSRAESLRPTCLTRTAVLPLFYEQAHDVSMMTHAMDCVAKAISHINPGQTPVITADQPLYALLKSIQLLKPESYGEDKIFIMMGSLHIEMASLRALGTVLEGSGWVGALVDANVTTQGRAESMLRGSHVTRTRYVHEVTAAVLYSLQQTAYDTYKDSSDEDDPAILSFEDWYQERCSTVPQFKYWDLVMRLEFTMLQLVASLRSADFMTYKHSLTTLVGWFFALDQVNYARWLSIHIRDLVNLESKHPQLAQKFNEGCFVARKTLRPFSAIGLDQNHEQMNAILKGNGGMIGLTGNPDSLTKLLLIIPELASMISKFECANFEEKSNDLVHHSDNPSFISLFRRDFKCLKETFSQWGNPFLEDGTELYNIETNAKAPLKSAELLQKIEIIGKTQYENFVQERLESAKKLVTDVIPQNRISFWKDKKNTSEKKTTSKVLALKSDCELFRKLFIACQVRQHDPEEFFQHENQPWPPSLSSSGQIRCVNKSDIMKCLISPVKDAVHLEGTPRPLFEAKVFDGPVIVHMLSPGPARTFQEYAEKVFCPFIVRECVPGVKRVDVVWDTYSDRSIKNATREKRGQGKRFVVNPGTKIPKSWPNFLRDSENKVQLFHLLATSLQNLNVPGVTIYSTKDTDVVCSSPTADLSYISPCNHEEADSRLILHMADAAREGLKTCMIRTSDSDVLVLAVAHARKVAMESVWVSIGTGKHHQLVNVTTVAQYFGPEKSDALPAFNAFTGCDTVSSFSSKGKKSAFETWAAFPEATKGFLALGRGDIDGSLPTLDRFVVLLYEKGSTATSVNHCRRDLFMKKGRAPDTLPPTLDALRQHSLRAALQGGHVWGQCIVAQQHKHDPLLWGWEKSETGNLYWSPKWTTLGQIQKDLLILMKCACKSECTVRCKCKKASLPCTEMCECNGHCDE